MSAPDAGQDWLFVRLPLVPETLREVVAWSVGRVGRNRLRIAHALGDMRWSGAGRRAGETRTENGTALATFLVDLGDRPALYGYSRFPLATLRAVPPPSGWAGDPIDWPAASATPVTGLLGEAEGLDIMTLVAPMIRSTRQPGPGPQKTRELDLRDCRPGVAEEALLGVWLAERWGGADAGAGAVLPDSCRILAHGEITRLEPRAPPFTPTVVTARLHCGGPAETARRLARGVGRYRSFGLGFVYAEAWLGRA